jgi:hypothetical protein
VILGICALPATLKIVFPATIFPATRFASPLIVCFPVQYVPAAIFWSLVPGVIVAAAFVVTDAVRLTDEFPAVPAETYPAVLTVGVTETVLVSVIVFVPEDTDAEVPLMDAGAVTLPLATDLLAADA